MISPQTLDFVEQAFYILYVHMFGTDVRKGVTMQTTALKAAAMVGMSGLLVVLALALGFGIDAGQAATQVLPIALVAAALAGFVVELERRAVW